MLSICPHLIPDYFEKVNDIIEVYRSQIVDQVDFNAICDGLVTRGVYSQEQQKEIEVSTMNTDKMTKALSRIQQRLWGFENFLMVLMDHNINPWLTEELFQAYSRYLVQHIKKQKSVRKCDCPLESRYLGFLSNHWIQILKAMDSWICKLGTSLGLGFLNQTLPNLSFSNDSLHLPARKSSTAGISETFHDLKNSTFTSSFNELPSLMITDITDQDVVIDSEGSSKTHGGKEKLVRPSVDSKHREPTSLIPKDNNPPLISTIMENNNNRFSESCNFENLSDASKMHPSEKFNASTGLKYVEQETIDAKVVSKHSSLEFESRNSVPDGISVTSDKQDIGLQYDFQDELYPNGYYSWIGFEVEDQIAALDISRISSMSLDLDWDLEDDEVIEFQEDRENSSSIATQTETITTDFVQRISKRIETIPSSKSQFHPISRNNGNANTSSITLQKNKPPKTMHNETKARSNMQNKWTTANPGNHKETLNADEKYNLKSARNVRKKV